MKAPTALIVVAMTAALAACGGGSGKTAANDTSQSASGAAPEPAANEAPATEDTTADAAPAAFAQCRACHSGKPGENLVGPSLAGVYNRKAGTVAGYPYSDALKNSGITWNDAALDTWLTNPSKDVPGTRMTFAGYADPAQRKQVIDYLKTL